MTDAEIRLFILLGWQDIRQRYRRSILGQFWITVSVGVMILCLAFLFGRLFQSPLEKYLPFLAIGLICWNFISATISEGCLAFIAAEGIIKQLNVPLQVHIARIIWRNLVVFGHNLIILPLIFFGLGISLNWSALLFLPGLVLLTLNLAWVSLVLGIICTRFRDVPQIIHSILQVVFYLTPIIWLPELLRGKAEFALVDFNPAYHLIELVRAPLLGSPSTIQNWAAGLMLLMLGGSLALLLARKLGHRVAYWL
jgi:ABC-type polysaccharide/polyol phosphate export permease